MIPRLFINTFRELNYTRGDSAGGEFFEKQSVIFDEIIK